MMIIQSAIRICPNSAMLTEFYTKLASRLPHADALLVFYTRASSQAHTGIDGKDFTFANVKILFEHDANTPVSACYDVTGNLIVPIQFCRHHVNARVIVRYHFDSETLMDIHRSIDVFTDNDPTTVQSRTFSQQAPTIEGVETFVLPILDMEFFCGLTPISKTHSIHVAITGGTPPNPVPFVMPSCVKQRPRYHRPCQVLVNNLIKFKLMVC